MTQVGTLAPWHRGDIQSGLHDKRRRRHTITLREDYGKVIAKLWGPNVEGVKLHSNYGRTHVLDKAYVGRTLKNAFEALHSATHGSRMHRAGYSALGKTIRWFLMDRRAVWEMPSRMWINLAIEAGQSDDEIQEIFK